MKVHDGNDDDLVRPLGVQDAERESPQQLSTDAGPNDRAGRRMRGNLLQRSGDRIQEGCPEAGTDRMVGWYFS